MDLISRLGAGHFRRIVLLSGVGPFLDPNLRPPVVSLSYPTSRASPTIRLMPHALPSPYRLAERLHDWGWLQRVYTQSMDGMYHRTQLPSAKIVDVFGSLDPETGVHVRDSRELIRDVIVQDCARPIDLLLVLGPALPGVSIGQIFSRVTTVQAVIGHYPALIRAGWGLGYQPTTYLLGRDPAVWAQAALLALPIC